MAWESGAQPVVLLTKTDLVDDITPYLAEVETVTLGACPVEAVSALTGAGLESLLAYFVGNRTAVLLGSSGVGKSTIVNALVGEEVLATQEVREDDHRGRHTTSHRELILLPSGGVVLDTPGIRELQLWDADLDQAFGDVEEIARRCRFSDCAHDQEPGCAIRDALAEGSLAPERWQSYLKLQRKLEGDRAEAQSPAATGTRAGVQDSRTSESTEETLSPPRVRDAVRLHAGRSRAPLHRGAPRPGSRAPPTRAIVRLERWSVETELCASRRKPARIHSRGRQSPGPTPRIHGEHQAPSATNP